MAEDRCVKFHDYGRVNFEKYWQRTHRANFLITGGQIEDRENSLLTALEVMNRSCEFPIIVLNGSTDFSDKVEDSARAEQIEGVISSSKYKNYVPFYGMNTVEITNFIVDVAKLKGVTDIRDLESYAKAFLTILSAKYPLEYYAICELAKYSDEFIANIDQEGISEETRDNIKASAARTTFKQILEYIHNAFENIMSEQVCEPEDFFNLLNLRDHGIYSIYARSKESEIFNMEISYELNQLLALNKKFCLILNDIQVDKDDMLAQVINKIKNNGNIVLGVCAENIVSWTSSFGESMLENFPSAVVFNGSIDEGSFTTLFKRFGIYHTTEVQRGESLEAGKMITLFSWERARNSTDMIVERDRITVREFSRYRVLIKGHDGIWIDLYRWY